MGKALLILITAALIGGSIAWTQIDQTNIATTGRQAERQEEMLAREIARSGLNMSLAAIRAVERQPQHKFKPLDERIALVGTDGVLEATHKGGRYEAVLYSVSAEAFNIISTGFYGSASFSIDAGLAESGIVGKDVLEIEFPSTLEVEFISSDAGFCAAIYLQRYVPGDDGYEAMEPDIIFTPGNDRDGEQAQYETVMQPGERMNFIMAVEQNTNWGNNCEKRGEALDINDPFYTTLRPALVESAGELDEMQEGKYAMIEKLPNASGLWRIAFEDWNFSDDQLADVKKNGYGPCPTSGNCWNSETRTYGGNGWDNAPDGTRQLMDYGQIPDFSDQVISVQLIPDELPF